MTEKEKSGRPAGDEAPFPYQDIIDLPHPEPQGRPRMTMANRAAQFSPFAALTGYGAAAREEARLTGEKQELSEDMKDLLDARLTLLDQCQQQRPVVTVTWFRPDEKKAGGRYETVTGRVKRLDGAGRVIELTDGTRIPLGDLRQLEGDLFRVYDG